MKTNAEKCKQYKARVKKECLELYDSRCGVCGFSDPRALQIDHRQGDPDKADRAYGRGSTGLYIAILTGKRSKDDFQCLCANCNTIKKWESPNESSRRHNIYNV